ncbi:fatty acid hydroxylase domain-containing protein 2-like [Branchiostoma floridae]|uniref:Fatty acid hydroxylase domain-containing protein 2-like n=1 Tax=Branchiostoma floridae TaxID=7739 RepID=A0A9J7KGL7_BRAFL|nr:fatty acid hydroxylase domain-containing protein 2-like [Branchiostoma floridae]
MQTKPEETGRDREQQVPKDGGSVLGSLKKCVFVLGSALLCLVAARNTITWHVQGLWKASDSFWQHQWGLVYDLFGEDEHLLGTLGTLLVPSLVFWLVNGFLLVVDMTGQPAALLRYKIQEEKNVPVDPVKLWKTVKLVLFNQFIVTGLVIFLTAPTLFHWRGMPCGRELPWFHWVLVELIVFVLVEEVMFYYSHRLLHQPAMYKRIHKKHHEWTAPIGIVAVYAHPVEHILSNVLPVAAGPILMGSHVATVWLWFCLALTTTSISHSGYHFPLLPSPEAHDFHHAKFNQCYGVMGVLDRLHGTDEQFRRNKAYERHIMLLGLTPLSWSVPDKPKVSKETLSCRKMSCHESSCHQTSCQSPGVLTCGQAEDKNGKTN